MTEEEFRNRFYDYWKQKYPLDVNHTTAEFMDNFHDESRVKIFLDNYARSLQECGVSRTKNNKAQRIFDELGIDPTSIEFGKGR